MFTIKADATGAVPAECVGTAAVPCVQPAAPSAATPSLYAYGLTAPKGGVTFMPDAKTNPDGSRAATSGRPTTPRACAAWTSSRT